MSPHRRALLELHACVVLWGFTAILGKLITLPAQALVWWRMLLVTLALACFPRVWRSLAGIPPKLITVYAGIGTVVAMHWLTFYGSVKLANASVAATCMALAPAVTALIEPAITGAKFERHNLLLGILVIPGVALVVGGIPGRCTWASGWARLGCAGCRIYGAKQALPGPITIIVGWRYLSRVELETTSTSVGTPVGFTLMPVDSWSAALSRGSLAMSRRSWALFTATSV